MSNSKNYYKAIAVMVGYIVGVGMFGLPYLIARAGVVSFLFFLFGLGLIQYLLHLTYANIIVATPSYHRLPGYANKYLGKSGKYLVFGAKIFGSFGGMLAYIIITGIFLEELLGSHFGGNAFLYTSIVFAIEAIVIYFGVSIIARFEMFMILLLFLAIGMISLRGFGAVEFSNYTMIDWKYFVLPYGAMLFALDGGGSLPMVVRMLKKDKKAVKSVVRIGTLVPILISLIFVLVVVGISGSNTSIDALAGVKDVLDDGVIFFTLIFGVLAMVTSFLGVAQAMRETLMWDFKVGDKTAWAIAVFVPYALYLLGIKDLVEVISFVGAIGGGVCGIVIVLMMLKLKKKKGGLPLMKRGLPMPLAIFMISLFVLGVVYEIYFNLLISF